MTDRIILLGILSFFFLLNGCIPASEQHSPNDKITIVTTTGMIGDAAKAIAGDEAEVIALMGPGVDPHLYKATQGDLATLRKADIIFYNGLHLEGKMGEVLEKFSREKKVFSIGEAIPDSLLLNVTDDSEAYDPHIWFDVSLWTYAVQAVADDLKESFPEKRAVFSSNLIAYQDTLKKLDQWVTEEIHRIPEASRVLITAHDAFTYFGHAYDIEVQGLQGISTLAEYGLRDVKQLVELIVAREIKAVFVESSVPTKSLEAVVAGCQQKGHEVTIGGTLYSDAMGEKGTAAATYPGMVRENVNTIVGSLK